MIKNNKRGNSRQHFNYKKQLLKCKRSQIAIFVIIAIVLVVSIVAVFYLLQGSLMKGRIAEDPKAFISECVLEAGEEALELIRTHGGYLGEPELSRLYENEKIAYLCYIEGEEELCVNKEPMLTNRIEQQVTEYITPRVEECFKSLKESLARYNPEIGVLSLEVEVIPNSVLIKINKKVSFVNNEINQNYEIFDTSIPSPMFDFARISNDIINQEVSCQCGTETCNADVVGITMKNRDFDIEKFVTGKNEEVYKLREFDTKKEFTFAIRNCVRLP